jgi:ribosomal protein S18 acetylase RimI-like enzyme
MQGLRSDEASFASHRTGIVDPRHWRLYQRDGHDVALALVNRMTDDGGFEIAYLGVVPEARGRALGAGVLADVLHRCSNERSGVIVLAVDESNSPARALYHRAGFAFAQQRDAWVRPLRRPRADNPPVLNKPMNSIPS